MQLTYFIPLKCFTWKYLSFGYFFRWTTPWHQHSLMCPINLTNRAWSVVDLKKSRRFYFILSFCLRLYSKTSLLWTTSGLFKSVHVREWTYDLLWNEERLQYMPYTNIYLNLLDMLSPQDLSIAHDFLTLPERS
jgi:hypothetical protein